MRRMGCRRCKTVRLVNQFGRCQVCGEVIAAEDSRGWWLLRARYRLRQVLPVVLVAGFAVWGVRSGWDFGAALAQGELRFLVVPVAALSAMILLSFMSERERALR